MTNCGSYIADVQSLWLKTIQFGRHLDQLPSYHIDHAIYTVSQKKTCHYIFDDNFNQNCPIAITFGRLITLIIGHRTVVSVSPQHLFTANILPVKTQNTKIHQFRPNWQIFPMPCCNDRMIALDLWPPNSPDLNPVDYKIWGIIQQRVYECRLNNVEELKQRLVDVCNGLQQSVIDSAVKEWRKRLKACVGAQGRHFEHLL